MKALVLLFACLLATNSVSAEAKVIISGQVFNLELEPQPPCNDGPKGPQYTAGMFNLLAAQRLGESRGGPTGGVQMMFKAIRRYPSRYKSPNCAALLRDECEKRCSAVKDFEPKDCLIQCNQYDSWNG